MFFTADTHFGHKYIIKFCNRPYWECEEYPNLSWEQVCALEKATKSKLFKFNVEEMDEDLIRNWNNKVSKNDIVWHLGDFSLKKNYEDIKRYFNRLNGKIHFVLGNHDNEEVLKSLAPVYQLKEIKWNKIKITLSHYAMRVWNGSHSGSWHLYGHSHGKLEENPIGKSMDVGVDAAAYRGLGYSPFHIEEIKEILENR